MKTFAGDPADGAPESAESPVPGAGTTLLPSLFSPEDLSALAAAGGVRLIDVRTPGEFGTAHLDGAENVPLNTLSPDRAAALVLGAAGRPVCLVCRSGYRARQALGHFSSAGAANVAVLEGGQSRWEAEGLPLVRGVRRVLPLDAQVRVAAGAIALTGSLLALFVSSWFALIPAFVGSGLFLAGLTGVCPMANLLALMPWNRRQGTCGGPSACGTDRRS